MRKRIFISMHYMELGGAEISLIGLLHALDYSKYEVDLFIHSHQGEMMQFIPKEVNLLPEIKEYAMIERPMTEVLREGCLKVLFARLKAKWQFRRYLQKKGIAESAAVFQYVGNAVTPVLPSLASLGEYDLAISFLHPHNIVRDKVLAKKKVSWIHTDYTRIDINVEQELPVWSAFDHIVSISPDVTKTFLQVFPSLKDKIVEMENILSAEFVRERAEEFNVNPNANPNANGNGNVNLLETCGTSEQARANANPNANPNANGNDNERVINILSVGRFCEAKNYDNVPDICRLVNANANPNLNLNNEAKLTVRWFLIGWGGDEQLIRQKIKEAGMEDNVIILGKRSNPYPYMKACDIYAQPSRYEGKSVTVREAQMLCKPVVITDYATAKSQIQDGVDGVIVPMDNEGCAKGIADFIRNTALQSKIVEYLQTHDYGNENEAKKIDNLI